MLDRNYVMGGKAVFTVVRQDGGHYTYKVKGVVFSKDEAARKQLVKERKFDQFLVYLLTGPDNESSYTYMGRLDVKTGNVVETQKTPASYRSKAGVMSRPFAVANWALAQMWNKNEKFAFRIMHNGHCSVCGRTLTEPESIELGIGPICAEKVYG